MRSDVVQWLAEVHARCDAARRWDRPGSTNSMAVRLAMDELPCALRIIARLREALTDVIEWDQGPVDKHVRRLAAAGLAYDGRE